jgi:hypothetical protein
MDVCAALVAYGEASEAVEPCEAAFHHPAMFAELSGAFNAAAGNAW